MKAVTIELTWDMIDRGQAHLWNARVEDANEILERAEKVHVLRCKTGDAGLQRVYESLMSQYMGKVWFVLFSAPGYANRFRALVEDEIKKLENVIEALVDDAPDSNSFSKFVARHVRLCDLLLVLPHVLLEVRGKPEAKGTEDKGIQPTLFKGR